MLKITVKTQILMSKFKIFLLLKDNGYLEYLMDME